MGFGFLCHHLYFQVLWHQALLAFAQRYKLELDEAQRNKLKALLKVQQHHMITPEIRRELFATTNQLAQQQQESSGGMAVV